MKKKNKKNILIGVSALAVMAAPRPAWAQPQKVSITCKQDIYIGLLANTGCAGSYVIAPNGAHSANGCLLVFTPAVAGVCTVTTQNGPVTKSAVVTFTKVSYALKNGGGTVTMTNLQMREQGGTKSSTKLTFSPAALAATVTIDIGGTLNSGAGQSLGIYSGKVSLSVTFQ